MGPKLFREHAFLATNAMREHTSSFVTPISGAVSDSEGQSQGSATYLSLYDKRYLLTNEHVARKLATIPLAYHLARNTNAVRVTNPFQAITYPLVTSPSFCTTASERVYSSIAAYTRCNRQIFGFWAGDREQRRLRRRSSIAHERASAIVPVRKINIPFWWEDFVVPTEYSGLITLAQTGSPLSRLDPFSFCPSCRKTAPRPSASSVKSFRCAPRNVRRGGRS
jgi:hypothetical protein